MSDVTLSVPGYDPRRGVVAPTEGGSIIVDVRDGVVDIFGNAAGFRDLARLCLALSDPAAPPGAHIHLAPGIIPLSLETDPSMLARERG